MRGEDVDIISGSPTTVLTLMCIGIKITALPDVHQSSRDEEQDNNQPLVTCPHQLQQIEPIHPNLQDTQPRLIHQTWTSRRTWGAYERKQRTASAERAAKGRDVKRQETNKDNHHHVFYILLLQSDSKSNSFLTVRYLGCRGAVQQQNTHLFIGAFQAIEGHLVKWLKYEWSKCKHYMWRFKHKRPWELMSLKTKLFVKYTYNSELFSYHLELFSPEYFLFHYVYEETLQ